MPTVTPEQDRQGLFVPDWWTREPIDEVDMNICSLFLGFAICAAIFAAWKAGEQSITSWKRSGRVTIYIAMLWLEWIASVVLAVISWMFHRGHILASFWFFLAVVAAIITLINISVFCIWIPARLQINETYIHLDVVWSRIAKVIFALVDFCLNFYFIHLVRTKLANNGLTKYFTIYKVNLVMVAISISLDVILVGLMSLPNKLVYVQVHPVAYIIKLIIEINMADLITKVAGATNPASPGSSMPKEASRSYKSGSNKLSHFLGTGRDNIFRCGNHNTQVTVGKRADMEMDGIQKTVETQVVIQDGNEDDRPSLSESRSSSMRKLNDPFDV
ncbi:hypothetical protein DL764_000598 [Monosporascus ibericus]|uniref:Uncharacterized protein n=1 Tax=Monosporascus ibericus TaxID=155417 RepID=A0A4Q4TSV7_9PEZI|nr:hypothetical protein DL764_000598 [Monosporascus ibericus]